jgi:hypothetical protein
MCCQKVCAPFGTMASAIPPPKPGACACSFTPEERLNSATPFPACLRMSRIAVLRYAPGAVNPPNCSSLWRLATGTGDPQPLNPRNPQPRSWPHEQPALTKIPFAGAPPFCLARLCNGSVPSDGSPWHLQPAAPCLRTVHSESNPPGRSPLWGAFGFKPTLSGNQRANTSAIRRQSLTQIRACSTNGVFAGCAALRSNTPFKVMPSQ